MAEEITFYTNPRSRGRTVRWMLEEVGAPYRAVVLDFGAPIKAPDYLRLNPMGKVPTIVHRGKVVTEVAAICAYLADAFPEVGLAPPPGERADYYRWLFLASGPLEHAITNAALKVGVSPEQSGFVGYGSGLKGPLDALESAIGDGYIACNRFTAADLYVGSQLGFGMQFGGVERRPAFEAYWNRLKDRPARRRATEMDGGEMG